jgi:hypothetical protein
MATTQSAYDWLREKTRPGESEPPRSAPQQPARPQPGPSHERDARAEIDRLLENVENVVSRPDDVRPRAALRSALDAVAQLQVATANLDACNPPKGEEFGRVLVRFADQHLHGHADAIERGMTYTADNTIRRLRGE